MPVRRFRSIEEMTAASEPTTVCLDNLRSAVAVSRSCLALDRRRPPAGVRKFRSAAAALEWRLAWERS